VKKKANKIMILAMTMIISLQLLSACGQGFTPDIGPSPDQVGLPVFGQHNLRCNVCGGTGSHRSVISWEWGFIPVPRACPNRSQSLRRDFSDVWAYTPIEQVGQVV